MCGNHPAPVVTAGPAVITPVNRATDLGWPPCSQFVPSSPVDPRVPEGAIKRLSAPGMGGQSTRLASSVL